MTPAKTSPRKLGFIVRTGLAVALASVLGYSTYPAPQGSAAAKNLVGNKAPPKPGNASPRT